VVVGYWVIQGGYMEDYRVKEVLEDVYHRLLARYGPQGWWPGGDDPLEIIIGAILTQNTTWANAERALGNLKLHGLLSARALRDMSEEDLAQIIRPSGYFNAKAKKLKAMAKFIGSFDDDLELWMLKMSAARELQNAGRVVLKTYVPLGWVSK
jgi:endonuclease-3 related protein